MGGLKWNEKQDRYLIKSYNRLAVADIAFALSRTKISVYQRANLLGLRRPENIGQFRKGERVSQHSEFRKGDIPFNKGVKQKEWLSAEAIEKTKKTRFGKGHKPHNYKPVGSERIQVDGYAYVKIKDPKTWKLKHHVLWEQETGEIVDTGSFMIVFKNKDRSDIRIENLEKIDNREGMKRNTFQRFPKELKKAIIDLRNLKKASNG